MNASYTVESILSRAPRGPVSGPKVSAFGNLPPWLTKSRPQQNSAHRLGHKSLDGTGHS